MRSQILQNLILRCVYLINILHQTNDYACTFYLVKKCLFLARNHLFKKRIRQEKVRTNFFGVTMLFSC
jgi:hypothetical protein